MKLVISEDGNDFKANLDGLSISPSDKAVLLGSIGQAMVFNTQERINQEVSPDGVSWVKSGRAIRDNGQTLRDTGRLFNSMTYDTSGDTVAWGTNVSYAAPLHYGAKIEAKNGDYLHFKGAYGWVKVKSVELPARPYLGASRDDIEEIEQILFDYFGEVA